MLRILVTIVVAYLCLLILMFLFQRNFIYFPSRSGERQLLEAAKREGLIPWRGAEGRLLGWRSSPVRSATEQRARIVVFHGNAGYALHRSYYAKGFRSVSGSRICWEIFLFEYPGYGARPGSPSEISILQAAREALNELLRENAGPVYLLGESLGSGVASRMAAEDPPKVAGLVLVTPLTCLADVAAAHYAIFPVRLLLREKYEVQHYLNSYPGPIAFLLAGRDEIIPPHLGKELFENYRGRKKLWTQPQAGHNTLSFSPDEPWWREVTDFLTDAPDAGE